MEQQKKQHTNPNSKELQSNKQHNNATANTQQQHILKVKNKWQTNNTQ